MQQSGILLEKLVGYQAPFIDCKQWESWRLRIAVVNPSSEAELNVFIWQVCKWAQEHETHAASEWARAWRER
eukprot:6124077-Pyramimonas_sp.AAC.1